MGKTIKTLAILLLLGVFSASSSMGQNYRDQKKLIRLRPNNLIVFGEVKYPSGDPVTAASISLFDPHTLKIVETIPVDDLGEYLFTLEKGKKYGLIVEKDGYFPYYKEFTVPTDKEEEWTNDIDLPRGLKNLYLIHFKGISITDESLSQLENLTGNLKEFPDLRVWIPEEKDPDYIQRRDTLLNRLSMAGINPERIAGDDKPFNTDGFIQVGIIGEEPIDQSVDTPAAGTDEINRNDENNWTLQFMASRKELGAEDLKGLTGYRVFKGSDGFYRYTYGSYRSREDAESGQAALKSRGFNQSIPKKIEDLKKL